MGLLKNNQTRLNEDGFTLVEVMIVSVIMGVLMLAFTSYMYNQSKQSKQQENRQNYSTLKTSVLDASNQTDSISRSEQLQFNSL